MRADRHPRRLPVVPHDRLEYLRREQWWDGQIRFVLTFENRLETERITRAFRLACAAEPLLGCRLVTGGWQLRWERGPEPDAAGTWTIVETTREERDLHAFLAEPMDPCAGPQVRGRLLRHRGDTLCIKINHEAADARGALEFIGRVAALYRRLAGDPSYRPAARPALCRGLLPVLRAAGLRRVLRGLAHFRPCDPPWGFPAAAVRDRCGQAFSIRRVEPDCFARVAAHGRAHGIPLNDILLAVFYRAVFRLGSLPPGTALPVQVAVDLRRYVPDGRQVPLCDLTSAFFPRLEFRPGETRAGTVERVHAAMAEAGDGHPWLGAAVQVSLGFRLPFALARRLHLAADRRRELDGRFPMWYSNLGALDRAGLDFDGARLLEVSSFGPLSFPPAFTTGLMSWAGRLILTASYCDTATEPGAGERFLDLFVEELGGLAAEVEEVPLADALPGQK